MKRDVDLIRQLLFEIERHGCECSPDSLRNGDGHEERIRYHLRLICDAGLAKETNRTSAGQPCVRLTNAGHEFLDLCRGDARWREAKWIVQEQTGGQSLAVLRAVLTKWAVEGITRSERQRRWRGVYRPYYYEHDYYRGEPAYRVDSYRYEREPAYAEEPIHLVRPRRDYREAFGPAEGWNREVVEEPISDESLAVSLPVNMI